MKSPSQFRLPLFPTDSSQDSCTSIGSYAPWSPLDPFQTPWSYTPSSRQDSFQKGPPWRPEPLAYSVPQVPLALLSCMSVPLFRLTAAVGPNAGTKPGQQPNRPADVRLIQQLINVVVQCGYVDNSVLGGGAKALATPLAENGIWSPALYQAIRQIERLYFYGRANPHGVGVIDPQADESLFVFLVALANGSQQARKQLSVQMEVLADVMVPGGKAKTGPDGITPIQQYFPLILDELTKRGMEGTDYVLYALATIAVESGSFRPLNEGLSRLNTTGTFSDTKNPKDAWSSKPAAPNDRVWSSNLLSWNSRVHSKQATWKQTGPPGDIYDNNSDLANPDPGDGWKYRGRGFIQITGYSNYHDYDRWLHLDGKLLANPDLADDPAIASAILAEFLKRHDVHNHVSQLIPKYMEANDFKAARRLVNHAALGWDTTFKQSIERGRALIGEAVIQEAKQQTRPSGHPKHRKPIQHKSIPRKKP